MGNKMEFEGYLAKVSNEIVRNSGDKEYRNKEILVEERNVDYPQKASFDVPEKLYDKLTIGEKVIVRFNFNAWEYNGKFFTKLRAWSISPAMGGSSNYSNSNAQSDAFDLDNLPL